MFLLPLWSTAISRIFSFILRRSNRSRHCSTNSGFESSISIDSAIDIQTPPPQSSNALTNVKANGEMSPSKGTSCEEKQLDSHVDIENDHLSIKDEPTRDENDSNNILPSPTHDDLNCHLSNPCSSDIIDDPDNKTFSSSGNDPLMVQYMYFVSRIHQGVFLT